jgi:probable HAF family extracellular repeat protein
MKIRFSPNTLFLLGLFLGVVTPCTVHAEFIFAGLGYLRGGVQSRPRAVSANGRVVVGEGDGPLGNEGFRWENGVMTGLGDLPGGGFASAAFGVSADGSIIVGDSWGSNGFEAFRLQSGSMSGLGDFPEGVFRSIAVGVSGDGSVVVGTGWGEGGNLPFRWESGVLTGLGPLPSRAIAGSATGISADGRVIVGYIQTLAGFQAYSWAGGVFTLLPQLAGWYDTVASATSADGSIIVGETGFAANGNREAFLWDGSQMRGLGDLPGGGFRSSALAVSADGSIVVGRGTTDRGDEAFIWTADTGMVNLQQWLQSRGVTGVDGWQLEFATATSANGNTIVGWGTNPLGYEEGWIVTDQPINLVPAPPGLMLGGLGILILCAYQWCRGMWSGPTGSGP